jgi:hypothetical protein
MIKSKKVQSTAFIGAHICFMHRNNANAIIRNTNATKKRMTATYFSKKVKLRALLMRKVVTFVDEDVERVEVVVTVTIFTVDSFKILLSISSYEAIIFYILAI